MYGSGMCLWMNNALNVAIKYSVAWQHSGKLNRKDELEVTHFKSLVEKQE